MDKPFFRLVGAPCGQHGQYTFYKALRVTGKRERIIAIGDFFFVRIWQDSELVSIGELQLLWTDRVSDQTLVSVRLYFLPENTPEGRSQHGEDEVLAINDKVVVRAEDLMSWMSDGEGWRWGLRAVWRGACAPPAEPKLTQPLHHTRLDFSDVDKEKSTIAQDADCAGVVVFSYPRYCRYRALLSRLEGIQADWLRDSLVAALGGYAAPTKNTRILYCKDTFEYPELEGHEFVCNHLAPRLKGRPRGRRRRAARSRSRSRSSRSSDSDRDRDGGLTPRRLSLRNGAPEKLSEDEDLEEKAVEETQDDRDFLTQLKQFYKDRNEPMKGHTLKDLSLRGLYSSVVSRGGYAAVCRARLWRHLHHHAPHAARRRYERFLLPFENHERKNYTTFKINGKLDEPQTIDTIDVTDSPLRDVDNPPDLPEKRLRTPSPKRELKVDNETGECKEEMNLVSKPAEELNREFLDSLKEEVKISVKPAEELLQPKNRSPEKAYLSELAQKLMVSVGVESRVPETVSGVSVTSLASVTSVASVASVTGVASQPCVNGHASVAAVRTLNEQKSGRPVGRSSLRAVRVKPTRPQLATAPNTPPSVLLRSGDSSCSPPAPSGPPTSAPPAASYAPSTTTAPLAPLGSLGPLAPATINNFGIHHPPPHRTHHSDDEIVEVPYKPKTPEIIDLDEYPESPQAVKKKKLDILKERGLEVTALPAPGVWPTPPPAPVLLPLQHQLLTQAQLLTAYSLPAYRAPTPPTLPRPPRVLQSTCTFGSNGPQKTVYGNPKDPFMPPPHVLHGAPIKPTRTVPLQEPQDILDLTCKVGSPPPNQQPPPAVEIVRVSAQNLTKNYVPDSKVGPNLEITLVNKAHGPTPTKSRPPQKRSSNGKFVSAKTPTPPKEFPSLSPSPSQSPSPNPKRPSIVVPTYQLDVHKAAPLTSVASIMDPYVALYSSLAGQMDQRQLAVYRDLMATQFRSYSGLLNMTTPTTKN